MSKSLCSVNLATTGFIRLGLVWGSTHMGCYFGKTQCLRLYPTSTQRNFLVYLEGTLYTWISFSKRGGILHLLLKMEGIFCLLPKTIHGIFLSMKFAFINPRTLNIKRISNNDVYIYFGSLWSKIWLIYHIVTRIDYNFGINFPSILKQKNPNKLGYLQVKKLVFVQLISQKT